MSLPLIEEIPYNDPALLFLPFAKEPMSILLDSSAQSTSLGRYSFIGVSPFLTITSKDKQTQINGELSSENPFAILKKELSHYSLKNNPNLPPFLGGAMGYFGYDLCHHLEKLPKPANDDLKFPDMSIGFYDLIIAFDHKIQRAWACSSGYPEKKFLKRKVRAETRLDFLLAQLKKILPKKSENEFNLVCEAETISSNFSKKSYLEVVKKVVDYIHDGDIFQANISQRFSTKIPDNVSRFAIYCKLRRLNPAPFSAYFNLDNMIIASSSPERFIQLTSHKKVETRPMKGTRPRSANRKIDKQLAEELLASDKDRAENIMIVDLMRNDLSRVCEPGSIEVPQLCGLESFETVHHLVSAITGILSPENDAVDLLAATFPGGSITGAPKVRAMEIIYELEPHQRGPYCGSIGYIGFDGAMDTSITIRTYLIKNNTLTYQVGGAIVADSDPEQEYNETLHKAAALRKTLMMDECS